MIFFLTNMVDGGATVTTSGPIFKGSRGLSRRELHLLTVILAVVSWAGVLCPLK